MKWYKILIILLISGACNITRNTSEEDQWIKPWSENPSYWQYKAEPVLLLGGTNTDNLFQKDYIETHLDSLKAIGGNYVRNTMSDRDPGDHRAFARNSDGKYDLDRWNDEYWERFEKMLKMAHERGIIVQIEMWDRFDHSRDEWLADPYNPKNNINYSYEQAGLESLYPDPSNLAHPFFSTVPELDSNGVLLNFQTAFVSKLLSYSLNYDNVLYCVDNETTGSLEWAVFWTEFIDGKAEKKDVYVTQMWNNWDVSSAMHKRTLDRPGIFEYLEMSQNSHNTNRLNWDNSQYVFKYINDNPRPVNSTKIYGSDFFEAWLHRGITTDHAIQTFFRNILGGYASSRFHRPPAGLGMNQLAINCIQTIRKVEEYVKMWEISPRMDLLESPEDNLAYLSASEGEKYVIYFTGPGIVQIDLRGHHEEFIVRPINIDDAGWGHAETITGGKMTELKAEGDRGCFILLIKK